MDSPLEIMAANARLLAPTAAELVVAVENGETAEMLARVQALSRRDYIDVLRAVRTVEKALSDYALSWQDAEYWGAGTPYPDEPETDAKAAGA